MIVLDTNVLSELRKPTTDANDNVTRWFESIAEPITTTAICIAEMRYGIACLQTGKRKRDLQHALDLIVETVLADGILPFEEQAAVAYGEIAAKLRREGRPSSVADVMIAAIVFSHEASLATRNVKHFEGTGVTLVNPFASPSG